jgi:hypothetical protein
VVDKELVEVGEAPHPTDAEETSWRSRSDRCNKPISWWRWYLDAGDAIRQIRFRGNRCRELLDANIFIGTEKAGILTQLEQWLSPYQIPIYPLGGNRKPCFPT